MSWYQRENKQAVLSYNITIVDMFSEDDCNFISGSLLKLPGVVNVQANQKTFCLKVSYYPQKITLEQIVFEISQLGYRYVNRA
ncbi:MAG: hypothetical protein MI748_20395 [Opitutales bacterium]|nr:hypothetical protein [Opitutales bacterium]